MTASGTTRLDLDDSRVVQINREPGRVAIQLEQLRGKTAKRIIVSVSGVTQEHAEYYIGHNVTAPHPNPASPLDYIEYAEQGPGHLELGGYRDSESWFVWRIVCTEIEIAEGPADGGAA